MESLTEDGYPPELVVEAREDRCEICPGFRAERRARSCTSLLYDPRWTLGQRRRWPDHLCYADFMQRSIEVWTSQVIGKITPAIKLWAECYPLPIGVAAAKRLYTAQGQAYPDELTEILPFQGPEEAYWGLRVSEKRSVLDMFGLKGLKGWAPPGEEYLWLGEYAYSLRGRDGTSLTRLVEDGSTWWRDFSLEKIQGRPRGSGTWESASHLELALIDAGSELRSRGTKDTQEAVAELLQTDDRGLRRWIKDFGLDWREVKKKF
jgi:hypothetical protein